MLPPLAPPIAGGGAADEEEVRELEYNPHRVFIKVSDLERHGFTAGCRWHRPAEGRKIFPSTPWPLVPFHI